MELIRYIDDIKIRIKISYEVRGLFYEKDKEYPSLSNISRFRSAYNMAMIYRKNNPDDSRIGEITRNITVCENGLSGGIMHRSHVISFNSDNRIEKHNKTIQNYVNFIKYVWNSREREKLQKLEAATRTVSIVSPQQYEKLIFSIVSMLVRSLRKGGFKLVYDFDDNYLDRGIDFILEQVNDELMYQGLRTINTDLLKEVLTQNFVLSDTEDFYRLKLSK